METRVLEEISHGHRKHACLRTRLDLHGRALDKYLQGLRRRGLIQYHSMRGWSLTEDGKEFLANTPEVQAQKLMNKMGDGKPLYEELEAFIRLYMAEDDGCQCHLCPVARKLLERLDRR